MESVPRIAMMQQVGQLTGMKYSKGTQVLRDLVYGYDEINRRTSYSGNTAPEPQETATNTATVDASNRYTSLNGKSISHDENGNQTINNAVWDARDRLVSLSGPGFTASFTYDALGRRSSKTVNGQTKTYLYDRPDLISETGADYTFGPGIDEPLERKSGQNEYYLSDALGSVIGLTDGTGAIKTSYNYSPFGKKQTTGTASGNPFAFTGREDDGTGYYYYRARYYNLDQKRFIAEDPLGFGGGDTNLYAYVGGNPINKVDPLGLTEFPDNFVGPLPQNGYHTSEMTSTNCGKIPPAPPNANLDKNMQQANKNSLNPIWFYNQVHGKGPWDYKQLGHKYEDFGNFNFGATGSTAGFPDIVLYRGAGFANQQADPRRTRLGSFYGPYPYGDAPDDQLQIGRGISYCKCKRQ
jgi:RHS repeat-associated protein